MKKNAIALAFALCGCGITAAVTAANGPPVVTDDLQQLGMLLYNDKNLSSNQNQSCRTCHHHLAGFADLKNHLSPETSVVSTGSDGLSKGGRNAPTSAYAGYSPPLEMSEGEYVGGLFWDGRAAGSVLGDPLAEQAQGPPLNLVEMAMPDDNAVIAVIKISTYVNLWNKVFEETPLDTIDLMDEVAVAAAYDNFGRAIAAYERSADVTKFTSKYDVEKVSFTEAEASGEVLFQNNCAICHSTEAAFNAPAPLFTNYRYANIGVPANPLVEVPPDLGLGGILSDPDQNGKFKIPTLRNIAMSAPYSHNGSFPTLESMVSFINHPEMVTPEVAENIDQTIDLIELNETEVNDIVAFLKTLTDDY